MSLQAAAAYQVMEHGEHVADLQRQHLGALQQLQLQHAEEVQRLVQTQVRAGMPAALRTAWHSCAHLQLPWRLDIPLLVGLQEANGLLNQRGTACIGAGFPFVRNPKPYSHARRQQRRPSGQSSMRRTSGMRSTVMLQMPGCRRRLPRTRSLQWQCSWRLQWMQTLRVRGRHAACRSSCVTTSWLYR